MNPRIAWLKARAEDVSAALIAAMFLTFMLQIVSRYIFNRPIEWTQEVTLTTWLWAVSPIWRLRPRRTASTSAGWTA